MYSRYSRVRAVFAARLFDTYVFGTVSMWAWYASRSAGMPTTIQVFIPGRCKSTIRMTWRRIFMEGVVGVNYFTLEWLTHWAHAGHVCISKPYAVIGSDNILSLVRWHAFTKPMLAYYQLDTSQIFQWNSKQTTNFTQDYQFENVVITYIILKSLIHSHTSTVQSLNFGRG